MRSKLRIMKHVFMKKKEKKRSNHNMHSTCQEPIRAWVTLFYIRTFIYGGSMNTLVLHDTVHCTWLPYRILWYSVISICAHLMPMTWIWSFWMTPNLFATPTVQCWSLPIQPTICLPITHNAGSYQCTVSSWTTLCPILGVRVREASRRRWRAV